MDLPVGFKPPEIKCPVVQSRPYAKRRGPTLTRPPANKNLSIKYNPAIRMDEVERFWILSAVEACNGNITGAANVLGMARETVYRRIREYNREKK